MKAAKLQTIAAAAAVVASVLASIAAASAPLPIDSFTLEPYTSNTTSDEGFGSNTTDDGSGSSHGSGGQSHGVKPKVIVFIFGGCLFGALTRSIMKRVPVPYTVVLLVIGAIFGVIATKVELVRDHTEDIADTDPHVLLQVFLPILIFESAFAMDVHTFMRSFVQVCILAVFGLMVASLLTATLALFLFEQYNWSFSESMMFGAIMSATDPVAVVSLLKDLGASKQLGTIIEGESLLNDGCAIVIFNVFMKNVVESANSQALGVEEETESMALIVGKHLGYFARVAIAGPIFGFAVGKLTVLWLSHIFNDALVEITITLAATYLTYYIGDIWLGVSGVLAVVVLGLIVNAEKTSISPEVEVFLHRFWEMLAYLANTLIFLIVGVVVTQKAQASVSPIDWFYLVALYLAINIIRGIVIGIFSPILSRIGYGLTWRNAVVMTWGGLRGAVGLALALVVKKIDWEGDKDLGDKFLFHTSGIVVLTLLINATTIQTLLRILGMSDISLPKRLAMANAVKRIQDGQQRTFNMLKADRFLADADWDIAGDASEITDPYNTQLDEDEIPLTDLTSQRKSQCPGCKAMVPNEPTHKEFADMMEESRQRMLKAEKVSYWKQFEHGMLAREAVRLLIQHTEVAADERDQFILVDELKKSWEVKGIYPWLKKKLQDMISEKKIAAIPLPKSRFAKLMYRISHHAYFEITINIIIVLNIIPIMLEFDIYRNRVLWKQIKDTPFLRVANFVFFGIYLIEFLIKIIGLRLHYFKSHWNKFDIFILVLSLIDIVIAEMFNTNIGMSTFKVVKLLKLMRGLRMLRLTKLIIPRLIGLVNGRINLQLSLGYDVGKGYVIGEEEVGKIIDHMVDNKKILRELKHISDTGRLQVIKELGLLQRDHPGIAVSVKTRQAIRTVLNHSRETIHELQGAGLLDEMEAHKLQLMVEVKMKRLMNAPSSIPPPPPENLLKNVSWLTGDLKLINFIKARASLLHFDYGEVIVTEGGPSDGLYLIVSGLVRLYGTSAFLDHDNPRESFNTEDTEEDEVFEDYLTVGNVIGEMGILTNKPRNATVICETTVQVYFISSEDMHIAIDTFTLTPSLEYRLWRVVAIRIATPLVLEQMAYQGWTQDRVKLHLERGTLADLAEARYTFTVDASIEDIILINGVAINFHTREELHAPCIISRSVRKLNFLYDREGEPRLLVIRNSDYEGPILDAKISHFDDCSKESKMSIAKLSSSMCLQHAAEVRQHNSKLMLSQKSSRHSERERNTGILSVEQGVTIPALPTKEPPPSPLPTNFLPNLGLSLSKERVTTEDKLVLKSVPDEPPKKEEAAPRSPPRTPIVDRLPPIDLTNTAFALPLTEEESENEFSPKVQV